MRSANGAVTEPESRLIECILPCSKALVCCGHNVLCLNLVFTSSLSDNYVPCTTQGVCVIESWS